jgi:hypothetical protein
VESVDDEDVIIRPRRDRTRGVTTWLLSRDQGGSEIMVAKMRITARRPRGDLSAGDQPKIAVNERQNT